MIECPVFVGADLTDGCFHTRIAIEDDLVQIVIFHAKPFSELLARRLKLCADDDSAEIEEDGPDAHLLFLRSFSLFEMMQQECFLAGALSPSSDRAAGFVPVPFSVTGLDFVSRFWFWT